MALALFDLDDTLLNGDSDHAWGVFLGEIGVLDKQQQEAKQDYFSAQYHAGELDIEEFLAYQLAPLAEHPHSQLIKWRQQFMDEVVSEMIATGRPELLEPHRQAGDDILIITATNDFITQPIADQLGVHTLIATEAERLDNVYSGRWAGTPAYRQGKVTLLSLWLEQYNKTLDNSYFYSDSSNDLPLLNRVDNPIAVNPDKNLRRHAKRHGWRIID